MSNARIKVGWIEGKELSIIVIYGDGLERERRDESAKWSGIHKFISS